MVGDIILGKVPFFFSGETRSAYHGSKDDGVGLIQVDGTMANSTILITQTFVGCGCNCGQITLVSSSTSNVAFLGANSCLLPLLFICKFIYHENSLVFLSTATSSNGTECASITDGKLKTVKDFKSQSLIKENIDLRFANDLLIDFCFPNL